MKSGNVREWFRVSPRFVFAIVLSFLVVSAGSLAHADEDGGASKGPPVAFNQEVKQVALRFANKHSKMMLEFLKELEAVDRNAYEEAVIGVFVARRELNALAKQDPQMHRIALEGWKLETKIHILAARLIHQPEKREPLEKRLAEVIGALVQLHVEQSALAIDRMEAEVERLRENQRKLIADREKNARHHYDNVLAMVESRRAELKKEEIGLGTTGANQIPPALLKKIQFLQQLAERRAKQGRELTRVKELGDRISDKLRLGEWQEAERLVEEATELLLDGD